MSDEKEAGAPAPEMTMVEESTATATTTWQPMLVDGEVARYDAYEGMVFRYALEQTGGDQGLAASLLRVSSARVGKQMQKHGIELSAFGDMCETSARPVLTLGQYQKAICEFAVTHSGGNKSLAAKKLGIPRRTLYRRMDRELDTSGPASAAESTVP